MCHLILLEERAGRTVQKPCMFSDISKSYLVSEKYICLISLEYVFALLVQNKDLPLKLPLKIQNRLHYRFGLICYRLEIFVIPSSLFYSL